VADSESSEESEVVVEEENLPRRSFGSAPPRQASLASIYRSNSYAKRIGKFGMVIVFLLFSSWMFFTLLLIMSYFPFSRDLFSMITRYLKI